MGPSDRIYLSWRMLGSAALIFALSLPAAAQRGAGHGGGGAGGGGGRGPAAGAGPTGNIGRTPTMGTPSYGNVMNGIGSPYDPFYSMNMLDVAVRSEANKDANLEKQRNQWLANTMQHWKDLDIQCARYLELALPVQSKLQQNTSVTRDELEKLEKQAKEIKSLVGSVAPPTQVEPKHIIGDPKDLPAEEHARLIAQAEGAIKITQYLQQVSKAEAGGTIDAKKMNEIRTAEVTLVPVGKRLVDLSKAMKKQVR